MKINHKILCVNKFQGEKYFENKIIKFAQLNKCVINTRPESAHTCVGMNFIWREIKSELDS